MLSLIAVLVAAQPAELGKVNFLRNFDEAVVQSQKTGKPIFILFDEVPGCSTVRGFGSDSLSNDVIVKAIEGAFIPVAIFNNTGGHDRKILDQFGEPTWNNPVVRIVNSKSEPLSVRFAGPYDLASFAQFLKNTLDQNNIKDANLVGSNKREKAIFAVHCFWECEAQFGRVTGVTATRSGFLKANEVVEVEFDSSLISRESLLSKAKETQCSNEVFDSKESIRFSSGDTKYYLKRSKFLSADLTEAQQMKMNSALRFGDDVNAAKSSCSK
jgi:hypothetical protein